VRTKLTQLAVDRAKTSDKPLFLWDTLMAGFALVVQPTGTKKYVIQYRLPGSRRSKRKTIGSAQRLDLGVARARAKELLAAVDLGKDPLKSVMTFRSLADAYFKREGDKLRTTEQRLSVLERLVHPHIGDTAVENIKRSDIIAMLDHVEDNNGSGAATNALRFVRRILSWHEARSDDFRSPITKSMNRASGTARERVLTDDEIRRLWVSDVPLWSDFARLLLLTAARRTELAEMEWSEVKDGVWTIPAERIKGEREFTPPLSRAAQKILASIPTLDGCDYVFTTDGIGPITGYTAGKAKLDTASGVTAWTFHDLRRTARTLLSRAGVDSDTSERCLGHVIGGVRGIYDRHKYQEEMRVAFERLATMVDQILDPTKGKVVQFPG
jgi:integrase